VGHEINPSIHQMMDALPGVERQAGPRIRRPTPDGPRLAMTHPTTYRTRIHVQGELSPAWSVLFADLTVGTGPDGTTVISGVLADEAGLHGLLATVRDLGLPVISVDAAATPTQPEHIR
jgi:hypothetical protein